MFRNIKVIYKYNIKLLNNYKSALNTTTIRRNQSSSKIAEFYDGKSVLVTGATGFIGKAFVQKLLHSCNDLEHVYVLIRHKHGLSPEARMEELLRSAVFDKLKATKPQTLKKLVPIYGDIAKSHLGLRPEGEDLLKKNVSIVIHSAATIRFDEPLPVVMNLNFEGTRRVMNLSRQMKNLDSFVYISTAFSQTHRKVLDEVMYPPPMEHNEVYKFIKEQDESEWEKLTRDHPNTYAFSKALTENYVACNPEGIPTVIVRPSIVSASYKDPVPGWVESWLSLRLLFDIAFGYNSYVLMDDDVICDLIPVDYVANLTLIAAAKQSGNNNVDIYNSVTAYYNPTTFPQLCKGFVRESIKNKHYAKYPKFVPMQSEILLRWKTLLSLQFPAYAADLMLRVKGEKPRHMQHLYQVLKRRDLLSFFYRNSWTFKAEKTQALINSLPSEDQKEFPCNPKDIDWDDYIRICYNGIATALKKTHEQKKTC